MKYYALDVTSRAFRKKFPPDQARLYTPEE